MLLVALSLIACGASSEAAQACPEPADGNQLLRNEAHGYCLVYPSGFVAEGMMESMVINPAPGRQGMGPVPPFVMIDVHAAEGSTAATMADSMVAQTQAAIPGMELDRSTITLGGEEAVVLDGVPGQELTRQLFVTKDDKLIIMTFAPADPGMGDLYSRMEMLYGTVANSFVFLP